ncbi:MAG: cysteine--tRNA ligase [Bacilli bacterium]|nr:cysteine--tRNA ligase [Bacilli bacterium]
MSLKVYNVLTRKKEEFIPQDEKQVKMYACGITVSDNAHVGHAYQAIVFDVIRKYLRYKGYDVIYVRNYTDVDDKIIINARKVGIHPIAYAEKFIEKTDRELELLNIEKPTIQARATENIQDMIFFIQELIDASFAYIAFDGSVYFRVSKFKDYGKFSNRLIDESLIGVRKEIEPGKEDEHDFALWKAAGTDEIFWETSWGRGRPGWHIECSSMSRKFLGDTLDIHGGGRDLIFPHHENEIAQSEALTGKQFSKYWIHNGLVKVNGQKMSKSLGNGILIEDLLKKYNSDTIKITLLQNHYRSDINIIDGIFEQHESKVYNLYKLFKQVKEFANYNVNKESKEYKNIQEEFETTMDNDFNTSLAISNLFNYITDINKAIQRKENEKVVNIIGAIKDMYNVLGLFQENPDDVIKSIKNKYLKLNSVNEEYINKLIEKRLEHKKNKEYELADKIRDNLLKRGIIIKDNTDNSKWDINI